MLYDLSNPTGRESAIKKVQSLAANGRGVIDISEYKMPKSIKQNKYLHLILRYFASQYGETEEYVKEHFFKEIANRDIFCLKNGENVVRSTSSLSKEEISIAIDRFRNWSAMNAGIYLPDASETQFLIQATLEIQKDEQYI